MIKIVLLAFLLNQGSPLDVGLDLPKPAEEVINCALRLVDLLSETIHCALDFVGIDLLPLPTDTEDRIDVHIWKQTYYGYGSYFLKIDDETQLMNVFNNEFKFFVCAFFHDFGNHGREEWILKTEDYIRSNNTDMHPTLIISFEYEKFVKTKPQAIRNFGMIANQVATFFNRMQALFENRARIFQMTGHGVGAVIAAKAIESINKTYGDYKPFIFAVLDPEIIVPGCLEILDICKQNQIPKIENSDVGYLYVLHTSTCSPNSPSIEACKNSTSSRMGFRDYFPNGGIEQPGCATNDTVCKRKRGAELFVESVAATFSSREDIFALRCENYEQFQNGTCPSCDRCYDMELFYAVTTPGKFYFTTGSLPPYV